MNNSKNYPSGRNCPDCGREIMLLCAPTINNKSPEIKCRCVIDREEAQRATDIERGRILARDDVRKWVGMGVRYMKYSFKNCITTAANRDAVEAAKEFADAVLDHSGELPGLYFCGDVGTGKTFLACSILNQIIDTCPVSEETALNYAEGCGSHRSTSLLRFYGTAELLQRIRDSYSGNRYRGYDFDDDGPGDDLLNLCMKAKCLVLDDFGAEKVSDWVLEQLYILIEYRYQNCLPLIITSNETPQGIERKLGKRIADRIRSSCRVFPLVGSSQRETAK
ncbi:MAG: hypothetical protein FWH26_02615 [Oscillospiraceae bacterium]|nr:hypothetical protein [Oscillospiraceae bacterium]